MDNYERNFKLFDEEIENKLDKKTIQPIYIIVDGAINAYRQLIKDERDILSGEYFKEFRGRLLGYIIKRAFDPELISGNFPFRIDCKKMSFNQRRPELQKDNIILTLAKSINSEELPSKSNYKLEYSKGNSFISRQMMFGGMDDFKVRDIPYYGIIRYEYSENELKNLDIIMPDADYKSIIKRISIPKILKIENKDNLNTQNNSAILDVENLKYKITKEIENKKVL
ncbi:MAG TPA: hypothetical protein DG753_03100 [Clostridium sp.]|nr:hypothetical protein [Clostridium sp.]